MVSWLDITGCNSWSCACKSKGRKETQNCDHCPLHNSIEENFCLWLIIPIHFFLLVLPSFLTNSFCTIGWGFRGSAEGSTTSTEGYGYTSGSLWRCWQWCSKLISIFPQCRYISLSDCFGLQVGETHCCKMYYCEKKLKDMQSIHSLYEVWNLMRMRSVMEMEAWFLWVRRFCRSSFWKKGNEPAWLEMGGQAAKVCNNLALAISMAGVSEALALGQRLGIDAHTLSNIFNSSSARCWSRYILWWSMLNKLPNILQLHLKEKTKVVLVLNFKDHVWELW